jgi:hypothetical protein
MSSISFQYTATTTPTSACAYAPVKAKDLSPPPTDPTFPVLVTPVKAKVRSATDTLPTFPGRLYPCKSNSNIRPRCAHCANSRNTAYCSAIRSCPGNCTKLPQKLRPPLVRLSCLTLRYQHLRWQ